MLKYFIFTTICLLAWSAVSAQDREQIPEDNLPPVNEVLVQASRHIAKLEPDVTQAYLYRQLAALFARSQNLDAAYRTLKRIRISESINRQTAKNLKRVGFLEDPQKKSEHLLNAARKLLEFGHPPIDK